MDLGLTDVLTFGKHKGQRIEDALKEDAGYLVWLREIRRKDHGDTAYFNPEVSYLLDLAIKNSRPLSRKYVPWNVPLNRAPVSDPVPEMDEQHIAAYTGWGQY
jgi:hypothetical protein